MPSNNMVVTLLACALILLAAGLVLYPVLIVALNNVLGQTTTTRYVTTAIAEGVTTVAGSVTTTVARGTVAAVAGGVSTTVERESTTVPATTAVSCSEPLYDQWMGKCYKKIVIDSTVGPITKASCGAKAHLPIVDSDADDARVQSYIDSKGYGFYYVNAFSSGIYFQTQTSVSSSYCLKTFWDLHEPSAGTSNAVMKYKGNGYWYSVSGSLKSFPENVYLLCQLA